MMQQDVSGYTGYLIRRSQQAHVAAWHQEVSAEVTSVQFGVLNTLSLHPGASQRDLCTELDLDRSTIADLVSRLERRGLIERVRDTGDKRRNVLHLTTAGEEELRELLPRVQRVDGVLTEGISAEDATALRRILSELLASSSVRSAVTRETTVPADEANQSSTRGELNQRWGTIRAR
jgi:DNA-binding MarR family transcriptional regulator